MKNPFTRCPPCNATRHNNRNECLEGRIASCLLCQVTGCHRGAGPQIAVLIDSHEFPDESAGRPANSGDGRDPIGVRVTPLPLVHTASRHYGTVLLVSSEHDGVAQVGLSCVASAGVA
jgi:hypothetical protein